MRIWGRLKIYFLEDINIELSPLHSDMFLVSLCFPDSKHKFSGSEEDQLFTYRTCQHQFPMSHFSIKQHDQGRHHQSTIGVKHQNCDFQSFPRNGCTTIFLSTEIGTKFLLSNVVTPLMGREEGHLKIITTLCNINK